MSQDTLGRWWPIALLLTVLAAGFAAGVTIADDDEAVTESEPADSDAAATETREADEANAGIVVFKHYGVNQDDKVVFEGERTVKLKRRSYDDETA